MVLRLKFATIVYKVKFFSCQYPVGKGGRTFRSVTPGGGSAFYCNKAGWKTRPPLIPIPARDSDPVPAQPDDCASLQRKEESVQWRLRRWDSGVNHRGPREHRVEAPLAPSSTFTPPLPHSITPSLQHSPTPTLFTLQLSPLCALCGLCGFSPLSNSAFLILCVFCAFCGSLFQFLIPNS